MNVSRWAKLSPWRPTSRDQVLSYLKWKRYPIPKNRKTKRETADEEALERLGRKHPKDLVIPLVLDARRYQKADAFLSDAHLGKDGRFHPEYTLAPKTSRLSCKRPNLMNQPVGRKDAEAEVAEAVLSSLIAPPGWVMVKSDWKAQESLLLGWFAEDPEFMRMSRLDIYSYLLSYRLGRPVDPKLPDQVIRKTLKEIKKGHPLERGVMKQVSLARGYGEAVKTISERLEIPLQEAQMYADAYEKVAGKIQAWQKKTRLQAHNSGHLTNPYGITLDFFNVLHKDPQSGEWLPSHPEANQALAFLPQSTGACLLKDKLLKFDELSSDEEFYPIIPVHDAIVFYILEKQLKGWLEVIRETMTAPIPELGGLSIDVEIEVGPNWAEMEEAA